VSEGEREEETGKGNAGSIDRGTEGAKRSGREGVMEGVNRMKNNL
jgi:hypothetical protein